MPIPAHDHKPVAQDDGEFFPFDEAQITGARVILALVLAAFTVAVFALGYWAGAMG